MASFVQEVRIPLFEVMLTATQHENACKNKTQYLSYLESIIKNILYHNREIEYVLYM